MSSELITTWSQYDNALRNILLLASKNLHIFDDDLSKLKLENRENSDSLQRFLAAAQRNRLCIVLKNAEPLRRQSPRLMKLLMNYPQQLNILECPPHLASVDTSLCLADDRHALVRIHKDHARARLVIDSAEECSPYVDQFATILAEGGEAICATTLGL